MRKKLTVKDNYTTQLIYVYEEIEHEEYVQIDCPMCGGCGEYEAYNNEADRYVDICCPCCGGDGVVTATAIFNDYIEDEIEVEDRVYTYSEGCVEEDYIYINNDELDEARENVKKDDILTKLVKGPED